MKKKINTKIIVYKNKRLSKYKIIFYFFVKYCIIKKENKLSKINLS